MSRTRYRPTWLSLREPADAAARAPELLGPVLRRLAGLPRVVVYDLGCGTGAMGRWLAGQLPGPQHWIMYDRDPLLLEHALARMTGTAADGGAVTAAARPGDLATLAPDDLVGADLVTASALLDLLTREEVERLAAACGQQCCPALLTLTVDGQVELTPAEPLDAEIGAAFNAHQRRLAGDRRLLGPDAVDVAAEAFTRSGAVIRVRPSPWRLGPDQAALTSEWLRGWVAAALAYRPDLDLGSYTERRLAAAAAGELRVTVGHRDLLAEPT